MNETNAGLLAIQIFIYLGIFLLLAFAIWGVYRTYKKRQTYQAGLILSLGAALGALGGMLFESVGLGVVIGIAVGFAAGAGLARMNQAQ